MKQNIVGIIGAVIAFISLALPWWAMSFSSQGYTGDYSIYLYQISERVSGVGSVSLSINLWYGWVAIALLVLGGLLGIFGSLLQKGRMLVAGGGVLSLLSIIVFPVGLQLDLSSAGSLVGLFSSGSSGGVDYTTYLSFGFWLALISFIVMLAASFRKPPQAVPPTPPPPPQPSPPPT